MLSVSEFSAFCSWQSRCSINTVQSAAKYLHLLRHSTWPWGVFDSISMKARLSHLMYVHRAITSDYHSHIWSSQYNLIICWDRGIYDTYSRSIGREWGRVSLYYALETRIMYMICRYGPFPGSAQGFYDKRYPSFTYTTLSCGTRQFYTIH
jgi:hypothetical protein